MLKKLNVFFVALRAAVIAAVLLAPISAQAESPFDGSAMLEQLDKVANALTIQPLNCKVINRDDWGIFSWAADGINLMLNPICTTVNTIISLFNFCLNFSVQLTKMMMQVVNVKPEDFDAADNAVASATKTNVTFKTGASSAGKDLFDTISSGSQSNQGQNTSQLQAYTMSLSPGNISKQVSTILNAVVLPVDQIQKLIETLETIFPALPAPTDKNLPYATVEVMLYGSFYMMDQLNLMPDNFILSMLSNKVGQDDPDNPGADPTSFSQGMSNLFDAGNSVAQAFSSLMTQIMLLFINFPQILQAVMTSGVQFIQNALIALVSFHKMAVQAVDSVVGNQLYQNAVSSQPDVNQLKKLYT